MGAHNQQHRRVAERLNRRLADDVDDEEFLKLIARFSPTQVYTETETGILPPTAAPSPDTSTPPTPTPTPVTPTPSPSPSPSPNPSPDTNINTNTDTSTNIVINTDTNIDTNTNTNTDTSTTPPAPTNTETTPPATSLTAGSASLTSPPVVPSNTSRSISAAPNTLTKTNVAIAPSSSSTPESGSGTNVGGIVGGIAAGLIGLVVVIFIVRFLMRRRARKNEESGGFNSSDFRRSAVLMNDPPTHEDTIEHGYNPRPPTMIERRLASPAPTFGTQYGAPGPYGDHVGGMEYGNMDQYGQFQSFTPGQIMNNMSAPPTANSANPLYGGYGQSPFSPVSPVGPYGSGYEDQPGASPYLTRQPSQLTRQSSLNGSYPNDGQAQYANYPGSQQVAPQGDYIDLDRSSVTPFQAAQYAEISKKLNTEVPIGLDTPAVTQFVQGSGVNAPPVPIISPFADPAPPAQQRRSMDSVSNDLQNFPAPPSPAHSSRSRIDSTPPTLPEIHVESRVTSYNLSDGSPLGSAFPSGVSVAGKGFAPAPSPLANQFPATPSPLASSFDIQSPPAAVSSFPAAAAAPVAEKKETEQKKRPETVYDDDDAYGGF
ncbi:hypothetical protein Hypma_000250 [Hypsizygus marmoreus]|uniref:Uncharacterized protein n=1 Tax=Hypsizygus marmoreus TaxID=39966 RepID=A0A369J8R4_HYPMA|nr:hypothetical protein Hypma_000250 [Hypsizygus marmoreus]